MYVLVVCSPHLSPGMDDISCDVSWRSDIFIHSSGQQTQLNINNSMLLGYA